MRTYQLFGRWTLETLQWVFAMCDEDDPPCPQWEIVILADECIWKQIPWQDVAYPES